MKTRAMLKEKREMIRHLPIIFSAFFLLTMYLPSQTLAGRITPTKTELGDGCTASDYSTAIGKDTTASGYSSTAIGSDTTASGYYSTAMGGGTTSSGITSTAMGYYTTASGPDSTAMGFYTTASGFSSTAMGANTTAPSAYETVIGRYMTEYRPFGTTSWNSSDRLFVIGNGTASTSRSDALVVLKNGNIGIGKSSPSYKLHVNGSVAGTSWTNLSSRDFKEDIRKVNETAHPMMLAKLMDMDLTTYKYKEMYGGDGTTKLGFIAEDMPEEVLSKDGKGVDIYELLTLTIGAMKAQQKENDVLKAKLTEVMRRLEVLEKL